MSLTYLPHCNHENPWDIVQNIEPPKFRVHRLQRQGHSNPHLHNSMWLGLSSGLYLCCQILTNKLSKIAGPSASILMRLTIYSRFGALKIEIRPVVLYARRLFFRTPHTLRINCFGSRSVLCNHFYPLCRISIS